MTVIAVALAIVIAARLPQPDVENAEFVLAQNDFVLIPGRDFPLF